MKDMKKVSGDARDAKETSSFREVPGSTVDPWDKTNRWFSKNPKPGPKPDVVSGSSMPYPNPYD